MPQIDPKLNLLEHSAAKVELYGTYLSRYLHILSKQNIFIFDLLCGEGIYENGAKGSPIIALETIKNHYYTKGLSCPNITVWFNDLGMSDIDLGTLKIDRVKKFAENIYKPDNVSIEFYSNDYENLYPKAIRLVRQTRKAKGLFFIDPYGYKKVKPSDIRLMLEGNNTEVLLWLPIAHMYRFAKAAIRSDFSGGESLRDFLSTLFGNNQPSFRSVYDFIEQITDRFRAYLANLDVFVDNFMIERDASNVYCLFFFTSHIKGYETMLGVKWYMDENRGRGHTINKAPSFSEIQLSGYPSKLKNFITGASYRTNVELYRFGLENGFLPKHTQEILGTWKKDGILDVISLDGKPVRGNYLQYDSDRRIRFSLKNILF